MFAARILTEDTAEESPIDFPEFGIHTIEPIGFPSKTDLKANFRVWYSNPEKNTSDYVDVEFAHIEDIYAIDNEGVTITVGDELSEDGVQNGSVYSNVYHARRLIYPDLNITITQNERGGFSDGEEILKVESK